MRSFIRKTVLFLSLIPLLWLGLIFIILPYYNDYYNSKEAENAIFIWGDSQTYRGINLEKLAALSGKEVYSAAEHGSGVYDFLIFVENVPTNSNVFLSISKTAQLRRKNRDRNMSGISTAALHMLLKNGYNYSDLVRILAKNIKPRPVFISTNKMYPNDDFNFTKSDSVLFEKIYREVPDYLSIKQELFLEGLKMLIEKNCAIAIVEFPYHPLLQEIERDSPIKEETEAFDQEILSLLKPIEIDTIELKNFSKSMHDYTHLNEYGATQATARLQKLESISGERFNYYLIK
jgi:hypothetical protein